VIAFDRSSKGAQAYLSLAQEILERAASTDGRASSSAVAGVER